MFYCDICKRPLKKKARLYGYCLCSKHMHQLLKHGKFLDNIQRTNNDLNDYVISEDGKVVIFNLYNQKNIKIAEFIVDFDFIEDVKYHKWRLSHNHVVTGLPAKGNQTDLSWLITGITKEQLNAGYVVDHIDCNPLNNRLSNLRICKQSENVRNKSFMSNNTIGFIGVTYRKDRDRYDPEIRINKVRCHLGYCKLFKEAVYKRYFAEKLVFAEFVNQQEQNKKLEFTKDLSQETKTELERTVIKKLQAKGLWQ